MDFKNLIEYQNFMQGQLKKEQLEEKKIEFLSIINQLTIGPKNLVQKEQILIEAQERGFSEKEVDSLLKILKVDNIIYEPSPGYIKKK